jgi:WD40 repeat protein
LLATVSIHVKKDSALISSYANRRIFKFDEERPKERPKENLKARLVMDRNEGIIRWSPNVSHDEFMVFNLSNRVAHLYKATGRAQPGRFDFEKSSKHTEIPNINTYDWSPVTRGLVSIGTSQGHVHLLRLDDNSNATLQLPLKLQRPVQSVAFNTDGLLAVGLDRVRNDSCLLIWDMNERLGSWKPTETGFNDALTSLNFEPKKKLEGSTSITSIRFFEDQPQTLVCGVKNQSVRVHDLRGKYYNWLAVKHLLTCCRSEP